MQDQLTQIAVIVYATDGDGDISEELASSVNHGGILYNFDYVLPVELTSFTVSLNENTPTLNWETEIEVNNIGFEIERKYQESIIENQDEKYSWETIGFVKGYGHSNSPKYYSFTDENINVNDNYSYRLKQIDNDGSYEYSEIIELVQSVPSNFSLSQNYPNPFNPSTTINYIIPNVVGNENIRFVLLKVYDMLGREVATLVNKNQNPGSYKVNFDASELTSGLYFCTIKGGDFVQTKKMILVK
ncbi:MAG: T9SS type A sorting domain-containing protein [Ignavibacteriae bacterium]|nr:T9SS type A sorting domain-containing protein [Ignavibacteriota bacterium]